MRTALVLAAILCLAACGGGPRSGQAGSLLERVQAAGVVRIGVKADTPPFGSERGGTRYGFDIDIAEAVARRLGVGVAFVTVTSADRIDRLRAGEVDMVVASMTETRARGLLVDFSVPYFEDGPALAVAAASPIGSYLDLAGRRVAVAKGSSTAASLVRFAPEAVPIEVPGIPDLLPAVADGRADAAATDLLILVGRIKQAKDPAAFRIAGGRIVSEPYGIAIRQDDSRWRHAIDAALMAMWEDGEWARICDAWFGPQAPYASEVRFSLPTIPP